MRKATELRKHAEQTSDTRIGATQDHQPFVKMLHTAAMSQARDLTIRSQLGNNRVDDTPRAQTRLWR